MKEIPRSRFPAHYSSSKNAWQITKKKIYLRQKYHAGRHTSIEGDFLGADYSQNFERDRELRRTSDKQTTWSSIFATKLEIWIPQKQIISLTMKITGHICRYKPAPMSERKYNSFHSAKWVIGTQNFL